MWGSFEIRSSDQHGVPNITDPWPAKDVSFLEVTEQSAEANIRAFQIVYVAIVGGVMLAAFLEWFLWLAAFLYCLCKVYAKAENISVKILAIIMMILFTSLRQVEWQCPLGEIRSSSPSLR